VEYLLEIIGLREAFLRNIAQADAGKSTSPNRENRHLIGKVQWPLAVADCHVWRQA